MHVCDSGAVRWCQCGSFDEKNSRVAAETKGFQIFNWGKARWCRWSRTRAGCREEVASALKENKLLGFISWASLKG